MLLEEEGRRDSVGLPPEEVPRARANPAEDAHSRVAGIALAVHKPVDRTRASLPLMERVQWGRDAREIPAVVGGLGAPARLGALEEGGEMEQEAVLVHSLLLLWRAPAGVGERALHRPLVGGSVVGD